MKKTASPFYLVRGDGVELRAARTEVQRRLTDRRVGVLTFWASSFVLFLFFVLFENERVHRSAGPAKWVVGPTRRRCR